MKTVMTDYWAIQMPEEWLCEQDEETIVISDEDEVSSIEVSNIPVEDAAQGDALLSEFVPEGAVQTTLAELPALYHELEEDGMFWREWVCVAEKLILIISHGMDLDNKGMDDSIVDEILSTLALAEGGKVDESKLEEE